MTILISTAVILLGAPLLGQALRWHDCALARRVAEEHRITPHEYLAGVAERTVLTEPWPTRQSPNDLAAAYQTPAPAPNRASVFDGPTSSAWEQDFSVAAQIWAHQQLERIHRLLDDPIGVAWDTRTAEWPAVVSLLGLTVPDFPPMPLRAAVYEEAT